MAKIKKNGKIDLDHYRSKYSLLYHVDNPATEKKTDDMLIDCFADDPARLADVLNDAKENG